MLFRSSNKELVPAERYSSVCMGHFFDLRRYCSSGPRVHAQPEALERAPVVHRRLQHELRLHVTLHDSRGLYDKINLKIIAEFIK